MKYGELTRIQIGVPRDLKHAVLGVDIVMGENLYGYNHNKKSAFLKVSVAVPKLVGIGKRPLCLVSV